MRFTCNLLFTHYFKLRPWRFHKYTVLRKQELSSDTRGWNADKYVAVLCRNIDWWWHILVHIKAQNWTCVINVTALISAIAEHAFWGSAAAGLCLVSWIKPANNNHITTMFMLSGRVYNGFWNSWPTSSCSYQTESGPTFTIKTETCFPVGTSRCWINNRCCVSYSYVSLKAFPPDQRHVTSADLWTKQF